MSATAQANGKKSSNSSAVNTPASTPVTNGNSQTISQSTPPPPNNNAPKYGTLVPNRIFVGGISANTTEGELLQLFSNYGTVKAAKIIQDRAGVSKGYGFITFESEDDAKRPLKDADNIVLRERKLNIAPAIKKQPFNRAFDAASPSTVAPGNTAQYFFPPSAGVPYFQGGVTYYQQPPTGPGDPNSQPTTVYQAAPPVYSAQTGPPQAHSYPSVMFPPPIYMPQQYPIPPMPYDFNYYPNSGGPQYMVGGGQNGPTTAGNAVTAAAGGGPSGNAAVSGGGGSSQAGGGPPMPPSTSPPRPPPSCYNAQLPPYPPDPVYYNMPTAVYGGPIETGGPLYPETLDMAANGGYAEVSQLLGEFLHGFVDGQDVQQGSYPNMGEPQQHQSTAATTAAHDLVNELHDTLQQQQPPLQQYDQTLPPPPPPTLEDSERQSKTPVVSILGMEQHQEKDFVSMQGGRRVKPQPPPPQPPQTMVLSSHHYPPPQTQPLYPPPPPPYSFNGPPGRSQLPYKTGINSREQLNNGWRKPRNYNNAPRNNNRNNHEHNSSSRSSLRTDSNSSANAIVDENKNEDGNGRTQQFPQQQQQQGVIMTQHGHHPAGVVPPPIHNSYHMYNGSRTYHHHHHQNMMINRRNPPKQQQQQQLQLHHHHHEQQQQQHSSPPQQDTNIKNKNNNVQSQQMRNNGQQNYMMTTAAAARRNKRSTRRNVQATGSLSEMGAGDAPPLPNNDVTDTCKKMETLKM